MLIGRTLLSRYTVTQALGSGGFGDTYLAIDTALPGPPTCVVKHLRPHGDDPHLFEVAQRLFEQEAQALYQLGEATHIPRLYAHFEEDGEFYLVQEFINGHDLSAELGTGRCWSEPETIQLLLELLEILAVVHQHHVIHRDIKPANVMRRQDRRLILIDFGAVKQISQLTLDAQGQTQTSVLVGSPGFMPAEQASGHPQPASDVYAVGMLAIQALTGQRPVHLPVDPQTLEVQWRDRISVSEAFAHILSTMVRYHFQDRYANASAALDALTGLDTAPPTELAIPIRDRRLGSHRDEDRPHQWGGHSALIVGIGVLAALGGIGIYQFINTDWLLKTTQKRTPQPRSAPASSPTDTSLVWRSKSNYTRLPNLNRICFGHPRLTTVQTVFGYSNAPLSGQIQIDNPQTNGCQFGQTFTGRFSLSGNGRTCTGHVEINWGNNDQAYLKWTIRNVGPTCPVEQSSWQINTYPSS